MAAAHAAESPLRFGARIRRGGPGSSRCALRALPDKPSMAWSRGLMVALLVGSAGAASVRKGRRRSRPICRPGAGGRAGGLAEGGAIMRCAPPFVAPASGPGLPCLFEARGARATESAPAASPLTRTGQELQGSGMAQGSPLVIVIPNPDRNLSGSGARDRRFCCGILAQRARRGRGEDYFTMKRMKIMKGEVGGPERGHPARNRRISPPRSQRPQRSAEDRGRYRNRGRRFF